MNRSLGLLTLSVVLVSSIVADGSWGDHATNSGDSIGVKSSSDMVKPGK